MAKCYEVLFYSGYEDVPSYYSVTTLEGDSPEAALAGGLRKALQAVREQFHMGDEVDDEYLLGSMYVLREDGLVSANRSDS